MFRYICSSNTFWKRQKQKRKNLFQDYATALCWAFTQKQMVGLGWAVHTEQRGQASKGQKARLFCDQYLCKPSLAACSKKVKKKIKKNNAACSNSSKKQPIKCCFFFLIFPLQLLNVSTLNNMYRITRSNGNTGLGGTFWFIRLSVVLQAHHDITHFISYLLLFNW